MKNLLEVSGLNAGYGKVPVLHDVGLKVGEGEVVAVIGPNGAGKTTLLKTISGLIDPYSGEVTFEGRDVAGWDAHSVAQVGLAHVPEGGRPFLNMTVEDNLLMGAYLDRSDLDQVLGEIYDLFPVLRERRGQLAKTLSGGEKQMLAIGRGLASKPRLLMLDEPSLGLAPILVDEIFEKLKRLRDSGLTVLLVEQNIIYALEMADRGYVLENGRLVMEGPGSELADDEHVMAHYLGFAQP
jgi:branched-chain amino acid transport system ATP-binding protein